MDSFKLNHEETSELYELLRYFGHHDIEDACEYMFRDESVPLENHWETVEDFVVSYRALWRFSRQKNQDLFVASLTTGKIDSSVLLSVEEKVILEEHKLNLQQQAYFIYRFLLSMKNKFEWELERIEAGLFYPMVL